MSEAYVSYSEARSAAGRGSDSLKRARRIGPALESGLRKLGGRERGRSVVARRFCSFRPTVC